MRLQVGFILFQKKFKEVTRLNCYVKQSHFTNGTRSCLLKRVSCWILCFFLFENIRGKINKMETWIFLRIRHFFVGRGGVNYLKWMGIFSKKGVDPQVALKLSSTFF